MNNYNKHKNKNNRLRGSSFIPESFATLIGGIVVGLLVLAIFSVVIKAVAALIDLF